MNAELEAATAHEGLRRNSWLQSRQEFAPREKGTEGAAAELETATAHEGPRRNSWLQSRQEFAPREEGTEGAAAGLEWRLLWHN